MRTMRPTVACDECGAEWDARTAGFCGHCGALLDSPAAPGERPAAPGAPRAEEQPSGDRAARLLLVGAAIMLVVVVAVVVAADTDGTVVAPATEVDLPTDAARPPPRPSEGFRPGSPDAPRPTCTVDETEFDCMVWERSGEGWGAVVGDTVVLHQQDRLLTLDAATGAVRSELDNAGVELAGGFLVQTNLAQTLVIDLEQGTETTLPVGSSGHVTGQPLLGDSGLVLVLGRDNERTWMAAWSLADESQVWRAALPDVGPRQRLVHAQLLEGRLLVHQSDELSGITVALDPDSGAVQWTVEDAGRPVHGHAGALVYTRHGEDTRSLRVRDATDGGLRWSWEDLGRANLMHALPAGDRIVVLDEQGRATAVDVHDGTVIWDVERLLDGPVQRAPTDDYLWEATTWDTGLLFSNRQFREIDLDTGEVLAEHESTAGPLRSAMVVNGRIYGVAPEALVVLDATTFDPIARINGSDLMPLSLDPLVLRGPGRLFRVSFERNGRIVE